ncbi:hypothetical protein [Subtercola boreus]|uniref:hypothetical protein n=1 Tax=Subtercola boreus TaxID=120213 RepID=UPI0015591D3E|nr:hypothetical protein [Subtercola boreus]
MRVFVYSLAVTVVTVAGLSVVGVLQDRFLGPGATISDAIGRRAFAVIVLLPVVLFYMLAVAGVVGVIRRRTWWAGALAGLIPALLFYGLSALMNSESTPIGTVEELAAADTVSKVWTIVGIAWCTIAGTALIKLAQPSNAPTVTAREL